LAGGRRPISSLDLNMVRVWSTSASELGSG
jgi:hypothetical protein